ncbi:FAD-dependent 5-carboxymethylaminomethyl-2-thiouridine(34) oxidoreductase MnmC [Roseateles violae]|uniref:tRNA 5-methylaminomethyl-2-thiouridine biosynthesis bifunctional protein MnmC n=1 Tax=Roseateles violae TaxID=3058042 RepID=A0ABT8DY33_9BURK|nr:FAD-dependent 5-carboxymethylaminomethyl-2-thiouridine(34) oxidoreductase MnmC [Pelomonas sp. PFR6]MDN3921871.1 FAD-dependent 5-carboxymethylaminomethyl-2-thiouridine(34) oxidoreductase MnmC [Pelomonas sp. PFR6]
MKTAPIVPAEVDFSDAAAPSAPAFGDVYHSRAGALGQARHVFLGGNGLPGRWAGRERFLIVETGFGLGNNFLASWDAWRRDTQRCQRLVFIGIEKHPLRREDLARAHAGSELAELATQLVEAWPPLTANLHGLEFEGGRVQLLLGFGDVHLWLRELVADDVDAFYLDGFSPRTNPAMWDRHVLKALGRRAAPGATAATWSVAPDTREGLAAAGFTVERQRGFANKGGMSVARHEPRHAAQRPAARRPLAPRAREAVIIGAGLAGAACAWALSRQGLRATVLEARDGPAQASSGNPGGLFHGTLNPDDGLHARFNRAAALATAAALRELPPLPWLQRGLLRLESERDVEAMRALIARQRLPADYVQALDAAAAAALSGLPLRQPAWFYPAGGALPPAAYVQALLRASGASLRTACTVVRIERAGERWRLFDAQDGLLAETEALLLAGGHESLALLRDWAPDLPLIRQRGQLSHLSPAEPRPRLPVAGAGYAIDDGAGGLWCGATSEDEDLDPALRSADHAANLRQWAQLAGLPETPSGAPAGRVGWRLLTPDRLPLVGGLADPAAPADPQRLDQPRFVPRLPGLMLCTAFGSRGISWAALAGRVAAALLSGAPAPLEASLLDAIDPVRFAVRRARNGAGKP